MNAIVKLYSSKSGEISSFLKKFSEKYSEIDTDLFWQKEYQNPIEICDIIGALIDNNDTYNINIWISLDSDIFINITQSNLDDIIGYMFERYPY